MEKVWPSGRACEPPGSTETVEQNRTQALMAPYFFKKYKKNRPLCEINFCGLFAAVFSSYVICLYGRSLAVVASDCPFLLSCS